MQKLREGKEYKFLVEKELTLPDGSNHFLLIGPDTIKYLVPVVNYLKYGISAGALIKCRVDRINCKGELFLEPENPWYTEGKYYDFTITGKDVRTDKSGTDQEVVIVTDMAGNKISVQLTVPDADLKEGTKLELKVERIKKGKVHLVWAKRNSENCFLKAGNTYEFEIERVEIGMDDEECFVVRDTMGNLHTIVKAYYAHYGYVIGTRFKGRVVKKRNRGEIIIEPDNPFYKEGGVIKMTVTGFNKSLINNSFTLNVKDKFGFAHNIDSLKPPDGKSVSCRVIMIKKGKPLFELLKT
jgi:hypothetical protein